MGTITKADFKKPEGAIKELIEHRFGDMKSFWDEMIATAMTIQGSGWVYLSKRVNRKQHQPNHTKQIY